MTELVVPQHVNGPAGSGNGGWTSGALATLLAPPGQAVSVRLHAPPPLGEAMDVTIEAGTATARRGGDGQVVLVASVTDPAEHPGLAPVPRVDDDTAAAVGPHYRGIQGPHPFPTCFTCGPARPPGDGLHLTPGVLPDRPDDTACVWAPERAADVPTTWAALDCPGGWSVDLVGRPMVLGSMTAVVDRTPRAGERCVVMGRALGIEGRKALTATTLWSGDEVLARATAVWIAVDPAVFQAG